jgi:hypothetical protein
MGWLPPTCFYVLFHLLSKLRKQCIWAMRDSCRVASIQINQWNQWLTSRRGGSLTGGGPNIGLNPLIHFCRSGSNFLLRHLYISSASCCTCWCFGWVPFSVRNGSSSLRGPSSQLSAVIVVTLGSEELFRAPCRFLDVDTSSSFNKVFIVILPTRLSVGHSRVLKDCTFTVPQHPEKNMKKYHHVRIKILHRWPFSDRFLLH